MVWKQIYRLVTPAPGVSQFILGVLFFAVFATSVVGGAGAESMVEIHETQQELDGIDDEVVADLEQSDSWAGPALAVWMQPIFWGVVELGKFGMELGYAHPLFATIVGVVAEPILVVAVLLKVGSVLNKLQG